MNELYAVAQRRNIFARRLFTVTLALLALNIVLQTLKYKTGHDHLFGMIRLFDVDEEANLPTLFSTLLLLSAGALLALISSDHKNFRRRDAGKWTFLSAVFLFLAVDESAVIHELLILPVRGLLGEDTPAIFHYAWVVPYAVLLAVLTAYFIAFFFRLPKQTRIRFIVAAALFVGGSIGFELAEGVQDTLHGQENLAYSCLTTVEEGMEMAGVIVFIHALLEYIAVTRPPVSEPVRSSPVLGNRGGAVA